MTEPAADDAHDRDHCPHCGANLLGEIVTSLDWELQTPTYRQLRREVGVEIPEVYDGVLYYYCPDCGGAWHAWTKDFGRRYEAARWYVRAANLKAGVPAR